jgi:uncharacterized membrane protein YdjX (TVP38/TMEM64 family)
VAPFSVINLIAGASKIRLRDFALGNIIGMFPAVMAAAFLTERLVASLRDPSAGTIATLIVAVAVIVVGLRHWLRK